MYGWNDRPTKAKLKGFAGGDQPRAVFEIGEYVVEISTTASEKDEHGNERYAEPAVTYRSQYRHTTDPRATLPGTEIRDGQIRIELTDLVALVLTRLEPVELARALWSNADVRKEFMRCLSDRYASDDFSDADRSDFLAEVKQTVHDTALKKLASYIATLEYNVSFRAHVDCEVIRINQVLPRLNVRVPADDAQGDVVLQFQGLSALVRQLDGNCQRGELEIGGRAWSEARDFWRKEVLRQFPLPPTDEVESSIAARAAEGG
jgi:hypothetical protein